MPFTLLRFARLAVILPVLTVVLLIGIVLLQFFPSLHPSSAVHADTLSTFPGTVSPLIATSHLNGPADKTQRIDLSIGLRLNNQAALTNYVRDIANPQSTNYHRFLSPAQFNAVFAPGTGVYTALHEYLQQNGLMITHVYSHHLLIAFSGTIEQIEQVFQVSINMYTTADGRHTFFANANDPSLPSSIVRTIQSFSGLNDIERWHRPPSSAHIPAQYDTNAHKSPRSVSCPGHRSGYLTPDQTAAAYNLNGLYNAHLRGEGQMVALFELDSFVPGDLARYTSCFGHSRTPVVTIVTGSGQVPADDGMQEVTMDAELVLSAAPGLGELRIYEAANNTADYNAEWAQIIQDAVPVISTSWGNCEKVMDPAEIQLENTFFMVAAAQGQSIFAASGDSGSAGCAFNQPPYNGLSAGDPGAQPFVTSVGGTSLTLNRSNYGHEMTWNNGYGASGGGVSQYWTAPAWQNAPGVYSSYSQSSFCGATGGAICRETPDVSLNADPANGYLFYCSAEAAGCDSEGGWYIVGGTSAAAPMWAAMMAMTNELSLRRGGFTIGFVNPLLYQIANNPHAYTANFHTISGGNNDYDNRNHGSYPASSRYNMATGLGSYNALALANSLVTLAQQAHGLRTMPGSSLWYFAEGSVGGGFQEFLTLENPSVNQGSVVGITYLFQTRSAMTVTHMVPASSRLTINVNADVHIRPTGGHASLAAIVKVVKGPGIVAERPMYFNFNGIQSGTDVIGTTTPRTTYYFANVDTRQQGRSYTTYISILNPSTTQTATTKLTFYNGSCGKAEEAACPTQTVVTPPLHRGTGSPLFLSLYQTQAVSVSSNIPVVVERPLYFRDTLSTIPGVTTGAASEKGAASPGTSWLFAEGFTGPNYQENFVLANFGTSDSMATIKLEYSNGHTQTLSVNVPALGQTYFDVNQANAHPTGTCDVSPCSVTSTAAAEVTATAPIVAERFMYFKAGERGYSGATDVIGEPGPATHSVYTFAEGYTGGTFSEYLTLQNPTGNNETVAVTLFADTLIMQRQVLVKAHSRASLTINTLINPIVAAYPAPPGISAASVSMTVQALGSGAVIVAERSMYFNFSGATGGTDVIGFTG